MGYVAPLLEITTSDRTGLRLTKACPDCGETERLNQSGYCPPCTAERNEFTNAVERLAEQISGGRTKYRALSVEIRAQVRKGAVRLHEAGATCGTAETNELTARDGFVYIITNKAWPEYVKIGRAFDPFARLSGYQTSCPYRDYELRYAVYFEDCHQAERSVHYMLDKWRRGGEWFFADVEEATQLIDRLRETTSCGQR